MGSELTMLFEGGKRKALTFSYDDGTIYDKKLVSLLKKYDMKATFNLNSGLLGQKEHRMINGINTDFSQIEPWEVKTVYAEGLRECRKMLKIARTGKYDGYLLEGMACPGGCIAGAGTIQPPEKSRRVLEQYKSNAPKANPLDSDYKDDLYLLHDGEDDWSFVGRH